MHARATAAVLAALAMTACEGNGAPSAQPAEETIAAPVEAAAEAPLPFVLGDQQSQGKVVYETVCWSCHGSAGRGDGPAVAAGAVAPPRDFTASGFSELTVEQLEASFRAEEGALNPQHPHMKNVLGIVDREAFGAALAFLPALTYPPELPGSALAGREIYVLRCQGCHGPTGRGNGAGAEALEVRPADFTQDTLIARGDFQAAFEKIRRGGGGVHGSSMPAWGVMLSDGQVWDLVSYISTFQPGVLSPPPNPRD